MFIKVSKSKNHHYLQLVHSYRENGVNRHKVIANLGRFDDLKGNRQLIDLGNRLLTIAEHQATTLDDLKELNRVCYGDIIYRKLWDKFKLPNLIERLQRTSKVKFELLQTIYLLVIDRLLKPQSKLGCHQRQDKYISISQVELQHLYRSLDFLCDNKEKIEAHIFSIHRNLFNMSADVVFYDVTTYHFESIKADELREFGFSKAGKFNEVQVVMGLLVDMEGRPIGYDLFPGNTNDGKTLTAALAALKKRYAIRRLILVADKGMHSKKNLYHVSQQGYKYIVSAPIKKASKKIKEEIFAQQDYIHRKTDPQDENKSTGNEKQQEQSTHFKYKIIPHQFTYQDDEKNKHTIDDKLIVSWSKKRAERDVKQRGRQIEKAQKMLDNGQKPNNKKGYRKYIATEGELNVSGLDNKKIEKEAQWDGYYGIQTNEPDLHATAIIEAYHGLWKIENAFRIMKHSMDARPIFHWTAKRIKGHFVVCFLALVLERALEIKLATNKIEASPETIKEALNSMEASRITLKDQQYYLKAAHLPLAGKLMKIFRIKQIRNLTTSAEFRAFLN